jgi:NADPH:quinone reductase-like Zn-dependent oxidoreductase
MTYKQYQLSEARGIDALAVVERAVPKPGAGEVLVRVRAVSLNYRDLLIVEGRYGRGAKLPLVPLSDGAGEVAETGAGVTRVKAGDRVAGIFQQRWLSGQATPDTFGSALGGDLDGMLSEYVLLRESGVVRAPEHLSFEEASTLPCAAVTAWNALTRSTLRPGITVLVLGTGGVSVFALQFAKLAGARVIVTSSSDEKLARAAGLGASDGINYRTFPEWDRKVRELTGGAGVDHVIEVGGAGTLGRSMSAVRLGGRISLIGLLSGVGAEIDPMPILGKQIEVHGILVGSRETFEGMNRAIALHGMRPVVSKVFGFEEAPEALRYLRSGAHFGKVVVRVG